MNPPPTLGIGHIALFCTDLASSIRFYRELLGYDVVWQPDSDNCYLSSGRDNLALHKCTSDPSGKDSRLDHFGILLNSPSDVDEWEQHLRQHEVTVETKAKTHRDGARSFYALDPDGNRIQFIHLPTYSSPDSK